MPSSVPVRGGQTWMEITTRFSATRLGGTLGAWLSTASARVRAYVTNHVDNTVLVIDVGTNAVTATVPVGLAPIGVAITPDGTHAYVTNSVSNDVSVIDTTGNTVIATVSVVDLNGNNSPLGVAITPDG